ncbi:hypothetical protein [Gehongia tenuis]|uniref:Uncharacterized protein n=1 Tax=Gehongia tenuis TaxID=2763655 RepID=A0A926HLC9_9FIRM|nr:hypothetical protein [Gehongia tenuis]MBC8531932.1 hypothetical protein [Gehongia tenuis]
MHNDVFTKLYETLDTTPCLLEYGVDEDKVTLEVKRHLPFQDAAKFVADVVVECVDEDSENYYAFLKDFMVRRSLMTYYTDFKLSRDVSKQYDFLYGSTLCEDVLALIDRSQYNVLCEAIDNQLEFSRQALVSAQHAKLAEIAQRLTEIADQVNGLFDNIDAGELSSVLDRLKDLDANKIMETIAERKAETI